MDLDIRHDAGNHRFEARVRGERVGVADYRVQAEGRVAFHHTETAPKLRGRGIASRLVEHALDWARDEGLAVLPVCPFVARFVKDHEAYQELVPEDEWETYGVGR